MGESAPKLEIAEHHRGESRSTTTRGKGTSPGCREKTTDDLEERPRVWLSGEGQAERGCRSRRGRDFVRDWAPYPDPSRKMGAGSSLALCSSNTNTISNPSPPPQSIYCHHCRYFVSPARFPLLQHCCVRSNFYYLLTGHWAARDLMQIATSASHSPSTSPALPPLPPDTPRCAAPTSQRIHRQPAPLKGTAENPERHNILTTRPC